MDDLLVNLAGGQYFSTLDLSQAYLQLPLDEQSKVCHREYTQDLYRYNCLPFGVSSVPSIFQRTIENLLQGIKGMSIYIDDILIYLWFYPAWAFTDPRHHAWEARNSGLKLNRAKCYFLRDWIEYLGYIINRDGLHPTAEKIRAIQEARTPQNISEFRSFFSIINYSHRFLPNLSTTLSPLCSLLQKDVKWTWEQEQERVFTAAKRALQDDSLLVH